MVAASAFGQDMQPADADRVVVSATRSAQKPVDVPASIDTVTAEQLHYLQPKVNLSESLNRVPGISVQNRQNYAQDLQVTSRGFGGRAQFGVRGVRLIADGVPASMPDGAGQAATFSLDSADRIEVLRGPFAALYGNASGGLIQIFSADGPPEPEIGAELWAGSYGSMRLALRAAGQSSPFNYRADVTRFSIDGYRDHSAATRDHANARLRFGLADESSLSLVLNSLNQADTQDPLGLSRVQVSSNPRQADPVATAFNTRKSIGNTHLGAAWAKRLANGDSLQLSLYGGTRDVRQFLALSGAAITSSGGVVTLERGFSGVSARWSRNTELAGRALALSAGAELEGMRERRRGYVNSAGVQGALRRDEDDEVFGSGAYVQGEWRFAERWSASAGVRSSRIAVTFSDHFIVAGNGNDSGEARFRAVTPVVGLLYRATPNLNLYGSYGRGFETPTLAELAYRPAGPGPNFDLKPARSRQLELGAKAVAFGASRINLALFHIETLDEIVVNSASGGRTSFKNASRTGRDGLELAWDIPLGAATRLYFSATHLDARFTDSFTSTGPVSAGNALPAVPRNVLYAEASWRHSRTGFGIVFDVRRSSKLYVDDANSDAAEGYTLASLRAGFEQSGASWRLSEFVRIENLFDRKIIGSVIVADANGRFFEPAPRRNGIVGVNASFAF
jgi:iron complex outermembrane receptor protein